MIHHGEANLWREVLTIQINDALEGVAGPRVDAHNRIRQIYEARQFLTVPNKDCDIVCSLAGITPDALRTRMKPMIADAPSPEQLIAPKIAYRKPKTYTHDGQTRTLLEWADHIGVREQTLRGRLQLGWSGERLFAPLSKRGRKPAAADDEGSGLCLDFCD